ncbi:YdbH domain-containing protein [Photobacterium sp. TY1-4]|uniref:YdbH domain-containing protein n=1 Tax=Photobacterium sp. TY1-4 TaxID=2899122 RepID=UPI0021C0FAD5|nr:YdbH domain-containing protein [Photobacterium sp. TY1-4]UXI04116.1 YdbH domain-containing protein [Photobacterium sp. TY1-4]
MSEDQSSPPKTSVIGKARKKYSRKVKLFIYGLFLILGLIVIPALFLPPWLASKGIEINAVSGISLNAQGLAIQEVSIAIQGNQLTFHQLSLAHFVEQQSAISNASWRLFAARSTVRLAPSLLRPLAEQGIRLGNLTLTNTAFHFIHLSKPYLFSAHAEQIETTLTTTSLPTHQASGTEMQQVDRQGPITQRPDAQSIKQQLHQVNLVLSTQPKPVLSGFIGQGNLAMAIPGDLNRTVYPFQFNHANFSLSWLTPQIPLSVHIRQLTPQWPTAIPAFPQVGTNLSLAMSLSQPGDAVTFSATQLHLDQPALLPQFAPQPQSHTPTFHLGALLSRLNQSPVRQINIDDLRLGNWLSQAQLHLNLPDAQHLDQAPQNELNAPATGRVSDKVPELENAPVTESPRPESSSQLQIQQQSQLQIIGKALAPTPLDITLTLNNDEHSESLLQAELSDERSHLACEARMQADLPLPMSFQCQAKVEDTRHLSQKLQLTGLPHAKLNQSMTLTLTQLQPPTLTNDVISDASYQLRLSWPKQLDIQLGKFALQLPWVIPPPEGNQADATHIPPGQPIRVRQLMLNSAGELQLTARYQDRQLAINIAEMTAPVTLSHPQLGQAMLSLRQIDCSSRFDALSSPTPLNAALGTLQCHAESRLQASTNPLSPQRSVTLGTTRLSSDLVMQWVNHVLSLQLRNNQLQTDTVKILPGTESSPLPAAFIRAQADNLTLKNDELRVELAWPPPMAPAANPSVEAVVKAVPERAPTLTLTSGAPVLLNADYVAEKLIGDHQTETTKKKSRLPVQKYRGDAELSFQTLTFQTPLSSKTEDSRTEFTGDYQAQLNFQQNNQRFPPFLSHGRLQLQPEQARLSGTLTNARQTPLMQFSLTSQLQSKRTHIQLQRRDLRFSHRQSLKEHYLPLLPLNSDLTSGSLSFFADLYLHDQQWRGEAGLFTEHLQGHIQGFHFADFNTSLTAEITPNGIRSKFPLSIRTEYLHAGLLLEDIVAQAEFDTALQHYALHRASTRTLGGTVSTRNVSSRDLRNIDHIPVQIQHLDLNALVELLAVDNLELSGILDGSLPLSIQDGLPVIQNGRLHSRYPGGILRYQPSADEPDLQNSTRDRDVASDSLKRISQILKNYKFDALAVDVDYSKEGKLKASSRFKGANPDFQSGQPVYINLNIEDDIPALIKTMNAINSSKLESQFLKQLGVDE